MANYMFSVNGYLNTFPKPGGTQRKGISWPSGLSYSLKIIGEYEIKRMFIPHPHIGVGYAGYLDGFWVDVLCALTPIKIMMDDDGEISSIELSAQDKLFNINYGIDVNQHEIDRAIEMKT